MEARVERLEGTVKWFNNAKGYGFLGRDDEQDVFIHYSSIAAEGYEGLRRATRWRIEYSRRKEAASGQCNQGSLIGDRLLSRPSAACVCHDAHAGCVLRRLLTSL